MEQAEATPETQAPESAAPVQLPSEESASQEQAAESAMMNALLRGQRPDSTSKPDDSAADAAGTGPGEEPAPSGDVNSLGRRGAAAEIARLRAESEKLQQALAQLAPPETDASEQARAAAIERERRFRTLLVKPESDADWTHDDITFLESEKQKRAVAPELTRHYDSIIQADRAALQQSYEQAVNGFWAHVRGDMASARDVPGVDFEAVKAATTFAERDRLLYAAGQRALEPELSRLRAENAELKRDLLGATRAPLAGGRSSAGRSYDENTYMNTLLRGGRT